MSFSSNIHKVESRIKACFDSAEVGLLFVSMDSFRGNVFRLQNRDIIMWMRISKDLMWNTSFLSNISLILL